MDYKELIRLSKKAACEWRGDHTFYQAGMLIDSLCSSIETLLAERDKALEELKDLKIMWDMFGGSEGITEVFLKAYERDAAVERGRWERHSEFGQLITRRCNLCGGILTQPINEEPKKYCPNCGAKMDLPEDGEQKEGGRTLKAHVGLSPKTKKEIEKYYQEYAEQYARQQLKVFLMLVCEAMITEYGFGPKRIPEFYEKMVLHMEEFSCVYDDSVEFAARQRLMKLGFDFDGEWKKWEEKYREQSNVEQH